MFGVALQASLMPSQPLWSLSTLRFYDLFYAFRVMGATCLAGTEPLLPRHPPQVNPLGHIRTQAPPKHSEANECSDKTWHV